MQPSRRTFLKTAAASAGAFWAQPIRAQDPIEVHVHFLGLFVALKDENGVPIIASVNDRNGTHRVYLAVDPTNYDSGLIGTLACNKADVRAFRISKGALEAPTASQPVKLDRPTTAGPCPRDLNEWRNPRWHVKLNSIGVGHKKTWRTEPTVDVTMKVQSDAVEAEPPLIESVRKLTWKTGGATQALTDRLVYVIKTDDPTLKFRFKNKTLNLKTVGGKPVHVYVVTVPNRLTSEVPYEIGHTLTHFEIGFPLLESRPPIPLADLIPKAVGKCDDFAKDVVEPKVVTALYDCLLGVLLSKTVFCPGYGSYP